MTTTDTQDPLIDSRGARQVVGHFVDLRLARLFGQVWRSLPGRAHDKIYAALGRGAHRLIVTDGGGPGMKVAGYVSCQGPNILLTLNYYALDDLSTAYCKYLIAHELGHVVKGHIGPPSPTPAVAGVSAERMAAAFAAYSLAHVALDVPEDTGADWQRREDEADAQAARWGYARPGGKVWQRSRRRYPSQWLGTKG